MPPLPAQAIVDDVPGQDVEFDLFDKDIDKDDFLGRWVLGGHGGGRGAVWWAPQALTICRPPPPRCKVPLRRVLSSRIVDEVGERPGGGCTWGGGGLQQSRGVSPTLPVPPVAATGGGEVRAAARTAGEPGPQPQHCPPRAGNEWPPARQDEHPCPHPRVPPHHGGTPSPPSTPLPRSCTPTASCSPPGARSSQPLSSPSSWTEPPTSR